MRRDNDCRTAESEQYNFFQNSNLRWCNKYGIGSVWQKYCNGLTLSLQQHEKIRLKQLFHVLRFYAYCYRSGAKLHNHTVVLVSNNF